MLRDQDIPAVSGSRDTKGAGDGFNTDYLSARLSSHAPAQAITIAQVIAAEVIRHSSARLPKNTVPQFA